jgi:putative ABC transport system permease protein
VLLWFIILRSAFRSLWANKMRSILAMLGIIIGVAAVIAMLAMGAGAQAQVMQSFQAMGTNLLFVRPAQNSTGSGGANTGTRQTLVIEDVEAIAQLPGVAEASPVVSGRVQAKYLGQNYSANVNGVAMPYFHMRNYEIEKGRAFTEIESEGRTGLAQVAVLGPSLAFNLFGSFDPVGKQVKFNGLNFEVIGVTKAKGDQGWNNPDDQALIPYTTAMKLLFANSLANANALREIDIAVLPGYDMAAVTGQPPGTGMPGARNGTKHETPPPANSVTDVLRKRHRLHSLADPDDFTIMNQSELLAMVSTNIGIFRILLGTIASISLLVGGIGIMNIMLVTVTERTREIGVRKAIGAKNRAILTQFVIEAVFMSGIGGMIGAGMGIGSAILIAWAISAGYIPKQVPSPLVQPFFVILSVLVSGGVGVVFGVYPAYRAAQLDPIDALRYE